MPGSTDTSTAGSDPAVIQKFNTAGDGMYPDGHLGALNESQQQALDDFRVFLADKGLYKAGPPPSHDDQTLLRYLRARRWVVEDAFKQFDDTEKWRKANQLEVLYDTIDVESYEQCRQLYPQWTGRRDRRGIPLFVYQVRHLDSKTISTYEKSVTFSRAEGDGSTPDKLLCLFALYENLTRFTQPLCTHLPDRENNNIPITLSTNIVDVSNVSLRMFWNLKSHMQAASQLATAHYPETLDRIFIIGAPAFFSTVWQWIKRWFDPITVSKIFILSQHEVLPTLTSFIDIKNIPKAYGGELNWDWTDRPSLDASIQEACKWENGHSEFPRGPSLWKSIDGGEGLECLAVGSVDKVDRRERVCTVAKTWRAAVPAAHEQTPIVANGAAIEPIATSATSEEPTLNDPSTTEVQGVENLAIRDDALTEKVAIPAEQAQSNKAVT